MSYKQKFVISNNPDKNYLPKSKEIKRQTAQQNSKKIFNYFYWEIKRINLIFFVNWNILFFLSIPKMTYIRVYFMNYSQKKQNNFVFKLTLG